MSDEPKLILFSDGLLSKWGFNDGDEPDELLDYCDDHSIPYPDDWHATLRHLVREHLIPKLDQAVEVYDIETIHNPIRASSVNGQPVDDRAAEHDVTLTPESVEIPYSVVLAVGGSPEGHSE